MREHLIVVVPGIGGSVLAPRGRLREPVWSAGWSDQRLFRHPEWLSLAENPVLEPVRLMTSLKPVPFWTAVRGYEGLLAALGAPHPTVLALPYDFRVGMVAAAEYLDARVRDRLEKLWPGGNHTAKVIVVAHSMGGLVARYWLGPGGAADRCTALITLGTPHWGAPKALDVLANGVRVKGLHVLPRLRDVLRGWPSMVELLPRYQAVVDTSSTLAGGAGRLRYPHELNLPWGADPRAAYRVHQEIERAWVALPRTATTVVPRIGYGHGTLRACGWDGAKVTVSKAPPAWPELGRWDDEHGDGTVPAYSGLPMEMRQPPEEFLVRSRHGQLGALDEVAALVARYEGRGSLYPIRGEQRPAVLGLDLDEVQLAGEPFEVAATLRSRDLDGVTPVVWASVTTCERARPVTDVPLTPDPATATLRGQVPALSPGAYTVTVTAREVPGVGDLRSSETVEVFDDADLA